MRSLLIFSTLFWLLSCASTPSPRQVDIGADVPQNWTSLPLESGDVDTLWWQAFQDDQLAALLDEAFERNYDLQIAAANLDAASAQATIAGAGKYPQVSAGASGSRRKQNFIGLPIPGAGDGVITNLNNTFGVSLDLSWEVDLWGRIRAEHISAVANVEAARADYEGARLSLAAQVTKSWFAAIEANRQVELSKATVENLELSHEQVSQRYESGVTSSLDYRLSLANLENARATMLQRQSQYDIVVRQLEILLGRYPAAALDVQQGLPSVAGVVPAGLPADIITRRPDLIAAERRWLAGDAAVSAAKRALLPRISLTGSTGTSTEELKDILNGDFSIWSIAGNILQPLFQGGRLRANVKLNKSQAEIAKIRYVQSMLNAFSEIETALANESYLKDREASLRIATEQSLAARELAESQYNRGISDFLSMLETQRSAYNSESLFISARRARLEARIDLYLALGGGFNYDKSDNREL